MGKNGKRNPFGKCENNASKIIGQWFFFSAPRPFFSIKKCDWEIKQNGVDHKHIGIVRGMI